jgi:hypothetical protein
VRFLKRRPESYIEQERGCRNCRHVFDRPDDDNGGDYFCTFRAPPRPLCGSSTIEELWCDGEGHMSSPAFEEGMQAWDAWSMGRKVEPWGICDEFRPREEET